jgi:two-component system CheB/CheR fusion protein
VATKKSAARSVASQATAPARVADKSAVKGLPGAAHSRRPIVGLGASAGGLEALEQFFRHMPADSGMGFVVVQHLDPSHESILTEILQRSTTMPVVQALDHAEVEPNHVYVIPPNRDMQIFHGALQLSAPAEPRGQRMPIDGFLRSLAEDLGEDAMGIILSGTGTDGTLGLRAIFGVGGLCLAQDPATARFDGMPRSAIDAGYCTQVLGVSDMPRALQAGARPSRMLAGQAKASPAAEKGLQRVLMILRSGTGHDFRSTRRAPLAGASSGTCLSTTLTTWRSMPAIWAATQASCSRCFGSC